MSYIAVELDVLSAAPNAARAAGVSEDAILGGLNRLWAYSFRTKRDVLHELEVLGCFAVYAERLLPTLRAFGWLDDAPEGRLRVRGADRYLRIAEARAKGGKAAAGNLRRGKSQPELPPGSPPAAAGSQPGGSSGSFPALSANSEQRAANSEKEEEAATAAGVLVFEAPTTLPIAWSGQDFFAWFQAQRQAAGLVGEQWPKGNLSTWWSSVLLTPGMSVERLQAAVAAYARSEHWRPRGLPWAGFASQWRKFVPPAEAHVEQGLPPAVTERLSKHLTPYQVGHIARCELDWRREGDVWVGCSDDTYRVEHLSTHCKVPGVRYQFRERGAA